jgi:co-chaperonin GroES (HSP10)
MIKILLHRVAIKQFDFNEWDEGRKKLKEMGWAIPETEKEIRAKASVDIGTIEQIGPTAFKDFGVETPIKVGDIVGFVKGSGKLVKNPLTEEEVLIVNDEDITCIFTGGDSQ